MVQIESKGVFLTELFSDVISHALTSLGSMVSVDTKRRGSVVVKLSARKRVEKADAQETGPEECEEMRDSLSHVLGKQRISRVELSRVCLNSPISCSRGYWSHFIRSRQGGTTG